MKEKKEGEGGRAREVNGGTVNVLLRVPSSGIRARSSSGSAGSHFPPFPVGRTSSAQHVRRGGGELEGERPRQPGLTGRFACAVLVSRPLFVFTAAVRPHAQGREKVNFFANTCALAGRREHANHARVSEEPARRKRRGGCAAGVAAGKRGGQGGGGGERREKAGARRRRGARRSTAREQLRGRGPVSHAGPFLCPSSTSLSPCALGDYF